MSTAEPVTIGVAIAVPEPHGARLQAARRRFGDPLADRILTHITLVGPRAVERDHLARITAHLAAVAARHPAYRVVLDGTGTFRPVTQVAFLRVTDGAEECARLAADLRAGPLACVAAYPYHPHVTLAHDVAESRLDEAQRELAGERIEFAADAVGLYVCGGDEHWRPDRVFPLTGAVSS